MRRQVITIHGGDAFSSREEFLAFLRGVEIESIEKFKPTPDWKGTLQETLGEGYEVLLPRMPNKENARYEEWCIWFEKVLAFARDGALLIGHSLGGVFLAKYLAEHELPIQAGGLFLVAAPFDADDSGESGDFILPEDLSGIERQAERVVLYHSADDFVVPIQAVEKYATAVSNAVVRKFEDRGHCNQKTFPELIADIKASQ